MDNTYGTVEFPDGKGYVRHGSPTFYALLEEMANTHDAKSHDYASDKNPSGNYHFAGKVAQMFAHSSDDAGFVGRIAEKIYRLANLESSGKSPKNESVADTEKDICVITALWMADRRDRRARITAINDKMKRGEWEGLGGAQHIPPTPKKNPLMNELFDLITLMPDSQTDEIILYIRQLREARGMRNSLNLRGDEKNQNPERKT
jgi:hypothetical protein